MDREPTSDHRRPPRPPFDHAPKGTCRYCGIGVDEGTRPRQRRWHRRCLAYWLVASDPAYTREFMFLRDQGACALCTEVTEDWEADHILRLADVPRLLAFWLPSNLQTLCRHCHEAKTADENRLPKRTAP